MNTLPPWLVVGALCTLPKLDERSGRYGHRYRVAFIKPSSVCRGGYEVGVQPIDRPEYKQPKGVAVGHCQEVKVDPPSAPVGLPLILAGLAALCLCACGGALFTEAPEVQDAPGAIEGGPSTVDDAAFDHEDGDGMASASADHVGAHPGPDAGPEAAPDAPAPEAAPDAPDAAPATEGGEGDACAPVSHTDGLGQSWQDCVPLGTYSLSEAMAACVAGYGSALACSSHICGTGQPSDPAFHAVCGSVVCWAYDGPYVGKVTLPASGGCPSSGSMMADWR